MKEDYIIIPGTQQKVYEGSIVILNRLPGLKWIIHCGFYEYNGRKQKGWYFASIPSDTTMPVFKEDLVAMRVIDESGDHPEPHPHPHPYPPIPPHPPVPIPVIFTPDDKKMIERSMITVPNLEERDKLSSKKLVNGKVVRVNDAEGQVEYYEWDKASSAWVPATLGYRYMTREEIQNDLSSTIVSIVYSDSAGALVVQAYGGNETSIPLSGIAHDPVYTSEDLTLRIPVFGSSDVVVTIPKDKSLKSVRFEENYLRPDGTYGPALVFVVSDGETDEEIVCNADRLVNIYQGADTSTISLSIDSDTCTITADAKLSPVAYNAIQVDNQGLVVDVRGKADKHDVSKDLILVSDGFGGFTYAGDGVDIRTDGDLETIGTSGVVTANVIAAAIAAAIAESQHDVDEKIQDLQDRVTVLEQGAVGEGIPGEVVVSTSEGATRSGMIIGGSTLSPLDVDALATEAAVKDAISWKGLT